MLGLTLLAGIGVQHHRQLEVEQGGDTADVARAVPDASDHLDLVTSFDEFNSLMKAVKEFGEPGFVWADSTEIIGALEQIEKETGADLLPLDQVRDDGPELRFERLRVGRGLAFGVQVDRRLAARRELRAATPATRRSSQLRKRSRHCRKAAGPGPARARSTPRSTCAAM